MELLSRKLSHGKFEHLLRQQEEDIRGREDRHAKAEFQHSIETEIAKNGGNITPDIEQMDLVWKSTPAAVKRLFLYISENGMPDSVENAKQSDCLGEIAGCQIAENCPVFHNCVHLHVAVMARAFMKHQWGAPRS